MLTALSGVTALPQRTITPQAWAEASHNSPSLPSEVDSAVDSIMAELAQSPIPNTARVTGYAPWIRPREYCSGAMWASVPCVGRCWRDGNGWILACHAVENVPASGYLRLSPAPEEENRVQYGFCPIRLNRLEDMKRTEWGIDLPRMPNLAIQTARGSNFRSDKMVISAVRLFNPVSSSPESERFLELLGRRSISVFIEDMLRGCYTDSSVARNILRGRDERYKEMIELIVGHAYHMWQSPTNEEDLNRFRSAMDVASQSRWCVDRVWPYLYTVVMPRSIFEANSRNLEAGIPPIIPHYVTPRHWMFNGRWSSPCTGLVFIQGRGVGLSGQKIVAGLLGKSNLDLPGEVSIWPSTDNPPQEWVNNFVGCIENTAHLEMPLDIEDRADLILHESHCIPVAFRVHTGGSSATARTYKYVRMIRGLFCPESTELQGVTVRECDPGGSEWIGEEVSTGAGGSPSTTTTVASAGGGADNDMDDHTDCANCSNNFHEDDMTLCVVCEGQFCGCCIHCCPGCGDWTCSACKYVLDDAGLEMCGTCGRERLEGE